MILKRKEVLICISRFLLLISLALLTLSFFAYAQQTYEVSPDIISKKVKIGDFLEVPITITNDRNSIISVTFSIEGMTPSIVTLSREALVVDPGTKGDIKLTIFGENTSTYTGSLSISGDIAKKIPINVTVTGLETIPVEALLIEIEPITEKAKIGDVFNFKVGVQNLLSDETFQVKLTYSIDRLEDQSTYKFEKAFFEEDETIELATSFSTIKEFKMPEFIRPGTYVINVKGEYMGLESSASRTFKVIEPVMDYVILGILPLRWVIFLGSILLIGSVAFFFYRKRKSKEKRYVSKVDFGLLPKPGPRAAYLGMVAETNKKTYFDLEQLTTHTLIAGSTGGGKTVSAEVMVEEALIKGAAVIVFDPTAQWTGFLRRCQEKKMLNLYAKFDLKKSDARAFNGNVRQILNAREIIDIKKFIKPGEINVFSISKLDPEDADILVSNTIREIFHANLPESPQLKLMIIFDEVHRLLPKFGGSGQGFIQIERAAREFRKWGVGLMLISQVLSDFVGETKANINTEIQMRTRDQGDLDRIKSKYGGYMLQSLLKSSTGTGMIENAAYNKGNPYFIAFRPLFHEHARLTDKELENYNRYNEIIDDLDFQIEQLEKEGLDVFDLKLELKMALDKVKSGSFNMVDIYLEGLKPRLADQWKKLGKEPAKRQTILVSESELREEFMKAQAARKKFEAEETKKGVKTPTPSSGGGPAPLRLKNGIIVTSKTELLDALEAMDDKVFKEHVTDQTNVFADWLKGVSKGTAEEVAKVKTRQETIDTIKKNL
jgi:hypothetical protein